MEEKKSFFKLLGCILICGVLLGGVVWVVDPFYHYHEPWFHIPIVLENAVYQTAGASRNLQYDSAIIGTSMTENIHASWLDEQLGWHTMKLSYSGARSNDLQAILGQVEQKEGELHHIIMDINDYQLTCESWTSYAQRPEYLYDQYLYNDYEYLFNHDTFVLSIRRCVDGLIGLEDNIDSAYTWEEEELFSKEITLNTCRDLREQLLDERIQKVGADNVYQVSGTVSEDIHGKLVVCEDNLNNVLPFIEAHPDTEIYIFVPPYSMLYWEQKVLGEELEDILAIYAHAFTTLLQYDNVRIFYFQNEQEIITNIDNYRDTAHHKPEYNQYIVNCIIEGRNELTLENYVEKLTEMYNFAKDFQYEILWEE